MKTKMSGYALVTFLVALLCAGCSTWRINRMVKQLKKDQIIVVEDGPNKLSPAMEQLVAAGAGAVDPLVRSLRTDDSDLRYNISVMVTLDAMGPEVPPKTFVKLLTHPGLGVPGCAADAVKARPEADLTDLLLGVMTSTDSAQPGSKVPEPNETAFRHAIDCLGLVGTPSALGGLAGMIDHPDSQARERSMQAVREIVLRREVGKIPLKIIDRLIRNLSDSKPRVRCVASMVLTDITGEKLGTLSPVKSDSPLATDIETRQRWESWWARNRGGHDR
ncbi:MAG: hypothetical protein E3J72_13555 [Planctomycetota bacterium]|nr:MAG: hypothetical protein E3J72_13555 [Planctomycetota bacterium]